MREEPVHFSVDALVLEGMLGLPSGAARGAVLCHPHPRYGGSMQNEVVTSVTAALTGANVATLRFNFRGVGGSGGSFADGVGEVADARAAVAYLGTHLSSRAIALVGYSFGAAIALAAAADEPRVDRVVAIAPPATFMNLEAVFDGRKPTLVVCGDRDPYCPPDVLRAAIGGRGAVEVAMITGSDHFFVGHEDVLAQRVREFASSET